MSPLSFVHVLFFVYSRLFILMMQIVLLDDSYVLSLILFFFGGTMPVEFALTNQSQTPLLLEILFKYRIKLMRLTC